MFFDDTSHVSVPHQTYNLDTEPHLTFDCFLFESAITFNGRSGRKEIRNCGSKQFLTLKFKLFNSCIENTCNLLDRKPLPIQLDVVNIFYYYIIMQINGLTMPIN